MWHVDPITGNSWTLNSDTEMSETEHEAEISGAVENSVASRSDAAEAEEANLLTAVQALISVEVRPSPFISNTSLIVSARNRDLANPLLIGGPRPHSQKWVTTSLQPNRKWMIRSLRAINPPFVHLAETPLHLSHQLISATTSHAKTIPLLHRHGT